MKKRAPNPRVDSFDLPLIGWREWIALPDLGIARVKAKVDTGARSSSLHAFDIHLVDSPAGERVRFKVHPLQRDTDLEIECEAPLHEHRKVRSSTGKAQIRPVIRAMLSLGGEQWEIDLTLTSRDEMGFRMLLGREAVRGRLVIDPGRSFLMKHHAPRRKKKKRRPKETRPAPAKNSRSDH